MEIDIFTALITVLGALAAVFIAGYLNLKQVKINHLTSSKIEWFRKIRDVLSNYLTNIDSVATEQINLFHFKNEEQVALKEKKEENARKCKEENLQTYNIYRKVSDLASRDYLLLKMLIYKNDDGFDVIEKIIDDLDIEYQTVETDEQQSALRTNIMNSINHFKTFFGKEWDRLSK